MSRELRKSFQEGTQKYSISKRKRETQSWRDRQTYSQTDAHTYTVRQTDIYTDIEIHHTRQSSCCAPCPITIRLSPVQLQFIIFPSSPSSAAVHDVRGHIRRFLFARATRRSCSRIAKSNAPRETSVGVVSETR